MPQIENGVRHTFWGMRISIRGTIRHEYRRTIGHQSATGGFKPHLDNTGDDARVIGGLNRHPANLLYAGCSQHVHELLF